MQKFRMFVWPLLIALGFLFIFGWKIALGVCLICVGALWGVEDLISTIKTEVERKTKEAQQ